MAGKAPDNSVLYTAVYADLEDAKFDLEAFEQMHKDHMIGKFDAAVIDKEDGKPHIVKRVDHPYHRAAASFRSGPRRSPVVSSRQSELGRYSGVWECYFDLHGASFLIDDANWAKTIEQITHLPVRGQHEGGEGLDALLACAGADHVQ